jgi:hypothetical protein
MCRRPFLSLIPALLVAVSLLGARPGAAQEPSPDAVAAARELVAASHAAEQLKVLLPLIVQQLKPAIVQGRAEVARDFDALAPQLIESLSAQSAAFADGVAMIYARNFSADELRQLASFYRSPIGQAFLSKMPVIAQQSMALGQQLGQSVAGELRDRMIEELRKRGHNI